eukprot:m.135252 g.135252  ORF g.135252 m.135252 type:complete len:435 (+) comp16555_c2_seq1:564-1868(+)
MRRLESVRRGAGAGAFAGMPAEMATATSAASRATTTETTSPREEMMDLYSSGEMQTSERLSNSMTWSPAWMRPSLEAAESGCTVLTKTLKSSGSVHTWTLRKARPRALPSFDSCTLIRSACWMLCMVAARAFICSVTPSGSFSRSGDGEMAASDLVRPKKDFFDATGGGASFFSSGGANVALRGAAAGGSFFAGAAAASAGVSAAEGGCVGGGPEGGGPAGGGPAGGGPEGGGPEGGDWPEGGCCAAGRASGTGTAALGRGAGGCAPDGATGSSLASPSPPSVTGGSSPPARTAGDGGLTFVVKTEKELRGGALKAFVGLSEGRRPMTLPSEPRARRTVCGESESARVGGTGLILPPSVSVITGTGDAPAATPAAAPASGTSPSTTAGATPARSSTGGGGSDEMRAGAGGGGCFDMPSAVTVLCEEPNPEDVCV